jgi:hypothetical protein
MGGAIVLYGSKISQVCSLASPDQRLSELKKREIIIFTNLAKWYNYIRRENHEG